MEIPATDPRIRNIIAFGQLSIPIFDKVPTTWLGADLIAIRGGTPPTLTYSYYTWDGAAFVALAGASHASVTLSADVETVLGLSGQELSLDTQTANRVFAGPTSGAAADPTFRALVAADIPSLSYEASGAVATHAAHADPHTGYRLESADHTHATTGAEAGQITDTALSAAVGIAKGGTGQTTAQAAINALTAVSGGTNEHVLTKDTATGNALWKAAAGGAGGGHEIRENGVAQTTLAGLDFIDADAGVGLLTDGATANLVHLDLYVLRGIGRAGGTTIYGGTAANENLILGGTSNATHTTSVIAMNDHVLMGSGKSIMSNESVARITLGTSTPHVTLTGDAAITGVLTMSDTTTVAAKITISPVATVAGWSGITVSPALTTSGNNTVMQGVVGNVSLLPVDASSGHSLYGLNYTATLVPLATSATATISILYGVYGKAGVLMTCAAATKNFTVTTLAAIVAELSISSITTNAAANADLAITTLAGFYLPVLTLSNGQISGDGDIIITNFYGYYQPAIAKSVTEAVVTTAIGMYVGDISGSSFTAANNRIVQFGTATPTTTSGLFEVMANFTAAANATPVWMSEGATPTRRQLKTFDPGLAGANFAAGQLVCVLV